jgi:predicted DNA-binding transcriptional regulator AlpA
MTRSVPRLGLNRAEVAVAIGVSANSVDQMVDEGFLPKPRKWHSRKIWIVSEIEAAMREWPTDGLRSTNDDDDWTMSV